LRKLRHRIGGRERRGVAVQERRAAAVEQSIPILRFAADRHDRDAVRFAARQGAAQDLPRVHVGEREIDDDRSR
jgi:hypothetical protein